MLPGHLVGDSVLGALSPGPPGHRALGPGPSDQGPPRQGSPVQCHRLTRTPQDLCEPALGGGAERVGLGGVVEEVVDQRGVVGGHVTAVAGAELLVWAAARARWGEDGRDVVNLEDGVTWTQTTLLRGFTPATCTGCSSDGILLLIWFHYLYLF